VREEMYPHLNVVLASTLDAGQQKKNRKDGKPKIKRELTCSNYTTKLNGRVEVYPQAMLTVSTDQDNWLASRTG